MLLAACTSIDCPVQNTVYTTYRVRSAAGLPDTLRYVMSVYSARSGGSDTLLLNSISGVTEFQLPISYQAPEDTLRFEFLATDSTWIADTVWIAKTNQPHFESVDCQMSYFHEITAVRHTSHVIDSIGINRKSVNYDAQTEQFHIVFKGF